MRIWLKRWMAYVLLPAGLVLLFVPLSTHRAEHADRDSVFLGVTGTLDGAAANSRNPPALQPESLAAFPALHAAIQAIVSELSRWRQDRSYSLPRDDIPTEEWETFQNLFAPDGTFEYENRVFHGRIAQNTIRVQKEVPRLKTGCKVVGILFLLAGLTLLCGAYPDHADGICIGRRSAIVIWDVAIISVGSVFTWWFAELVLARGFQTATEWGEDFTVGMGVFWVVLANPVLALITSAVSSQTLRITRNAIVLKGLLSSSTVLWSELEGIGVSRACSARKAGSLWAPHRLMKILKIHGGGSTLHILEPPYASTKKLILEALSEQAPDKWRERIATVAKEWLSTW